LKRAGDEMSFKYRVCYEQYDSTGGASSKNLDDCSKESEKVFAIWLEGSWGNVALISLVPIPFAWLMVYGIIRVFRWVRAGFKPD
jgi:hypothetical protein